MLFLWAAVYCVLKISLGGTSVSVCGFLTYSFCFLLYFFHVRLASAAAQITTGPRRCSFPPNVRRRAKLFSRHFNGFVCVAQRRRTAVGPMHAVHNTGRESGILCSGIAEKLSWVA